MIKTWKLNIYNNEWIRILHYNKKLISISSYEGIHLWENLNSNDGYEIKDNKLVIIGVDDIDN